MPMKRRRRTTVPTPKSAPVEWLAIASDQAKRVSESEACRVLGDAD
jgi:hypothetical protein